MSPFRLCLSFLLLLLSACDVGSSPEPVATHEQALAPIPKVSWRFADFPVVSSGYSMASLGSQAVLFATNEGMYLWDGTGWTPRKAEGWPEFRPVSRMVGHGPGLLLFGGYNSNSGAYYDETWQWDGTRWTQLFPATTPPARSDQVMAVVGGKVVMFGGNSPQGRLTDTWTWDGEDWTRIPTTRAPATESAWNSMVALGGSALLIGRMNFSNTPPETWTFDGQDWTRLSPVNTPSTTSYSLLATLGGTAFAYDGTDTWQWTGTDWLKVSVATAPPTRSPGVMATAGPAILHFGGSSGSTSLRDTWTFDGATWTERWRRPVSIKGASMATLNGKAVLFRGTETWEYDGRSWTQRMPATVPPSRSQAAMATLGNKVVMYGGTNDTRTWLWDGNNWTALTTATHPGPRQTVGMAPLGNKLILFGGLNMSQLALSDTWEFDGVNWRQLSPTNRPSPRGGYGMTAVGGKVLLFGGAYTDGANPANTYYNADAWLFDGTNWASAAWGPGARYAPILAELDGRAVLHGGRSSPASNGVFLSDTWIFDPQTGWSQPQVNRKAPGIHEATATTLGHTVVMWGGGVIYWYGTSGTWTVSASLAVGAACDSAVQCESGACVDGVCCQTACSGTCQACNLPGTEGVCTPVPAGEPRPGTCERCDGDGGCELPWPEDAGTPDAGTPDAGTPDAGLPDAGTDGGTDAGTKVDAGTGSGGGGTGCARDLTGLNACLMAFAVTLGLWGRRRPED
jgi:hypothetical protein